MNDILTRLSTSIAHREGPAAARAWKKRKVELVIGTDREIGRKEARCGLGGSTQERRVGITPQHVADLREMFRGLELQLSVLVVERAGARAGYADADYVHAGAEILGQDELIWHDGPPDVVHALKEPSNCEADLPGPFLRIGALHLGDFHEGSGFSRLLEKSNVTVFDGSNIGATKAYRIPVRGCMSVFAGQIAAEWVIEHLAARGLQGQVVVAGGGNAGKACVRKLLAGGGVGKVVIVENAQDPTRVRAIAQEFADTDRVQVVPNEGIDSPALLAALKDAVGLVSAVAVANRRSPHIVSVEALDALNDNAMIVDISIDERGAIEDPRVQVGWASEQLIEHFETALLPRRYRAVSNMPRAYPFEASKVHGDAIVPYIATLLYLAAREGGARGVTDYLHGIAADPDCPDPLHAPEPEMVDAFVHDLRNGMAVHPTPRGLLLGSIIPAADRAAIIGFLHSKGIAIDPDSFPK